MIIITKRLKLDGPRDARNLIKLWLKDVANTGQLPFEGRVGGVIVQMLNCWLKAYELEKTADVEKRLKALEAANERKH